MQERQSRQPHSELFSSPLANRAPKVDATNNGIRRNLPDRLNNIPDPFITIATTAFQVRDAVNSDGTDFEEIAEQLNENQKKEEQLGSLFGFLVSLIAFVRWLVHKIQKKKNTYEDIYQEMKEKCNPWHYRFSVASRECEHIATIFFSFLPPALSPFQRLAAGIVGVIAGVITVLLTKSSVNSEEKVLFTLGGSEGWTNYISTGSSIGSMVGAGIGAIIGLLIPLPFTMPACIALFGAIGGLVGALVTGAGVPLINKLFPTVNEKYHLGYAKAGALVGSTLGGILGFIIGFFIPIPGMAALGATIGMGFGAAIGAITMAVAGPTITEKIDEESCWDSAIRRPGSVGSTVGAVPGFFLETFQEGAQQLASNIGTLIAAGIGFAYDLWAASKRKNKPSSLEEITPNNKKDSISWTNRLNLFAGIGTTLGSVIGFFIGGPVGMFVGAAIGAVVGSVIGLTAGNYICEKMITFGHWMTKKLDAFFCHPENNEASNHDELHENKKQRVGTEGAMVLPGEQRDEIEEDEENEVVVPPRPASAPIPIPPRKKQLFYDPAEAVLSKVAMQPCSQPNLLSSHSLWASPSPSFAFSRTNGLAQSCPCFQNRVGV